MIERLETTLKKYNELEQELTRPEVLSDVKKTREYSKEMASLADIVNCYKKYKKTLEDIESTKEMVKDHDLGDMAKEELKALEAEKVKLDGELEILRFSDFQMDALTGDFAGEIRLALLKKGDKVIKLTGGSLAANIKDVQNNITLSKEMQNFDAFTVPKAIKLRDVEISGK